LEANAYITGSGNVSYANPTSHDSGIWSFSGYWL
jgi:hypothetical protein